MSLRFFFSIDICLGSVWFVRQWVIVGIVEISILCDQLIPFVVYSSWGVVLQETKLCLVADREMLDEQLIMSVNSLTKEQSFTIKD